MSPPKFSIEAWEALLYYAGLPNAGLPSTKLLPFTSEQRGAVQYLRSCRRWTKELELVLVQKFLDNEEVDVVVFGYTDLDRQEAFDRLREALCSDGAKN